jgi:hybrid cluster-associated redox disulfide protein
MKAEIRRQLKLSIQAQIEGQTASIGPVQREFAEFNDKVQGFNRAISKVERDLALLEATIASITPFHPKMTVHEAWAKHPSVKEIFAAHHLPHCDRCPVGADERLEEAAFGYAIDLRELLDALNALC